MPHNVSLQYTDQLCRSETLVTKKHDLSKSSLSPHHISEQSFIKVENMIKSCPNHKSNRIFYWTLASKDFWFQAHILNDNSNKHIDSYIPYSTYVDTSHMRQAQLLEKFYNRHELKPKKEGRNNVFHCRHRNNKTIADIRA